MPALPQDHSGEAVVHSGVVIGPPVVCRESDSVARCESALAAAVAGSDDGVVASGCVRARRDRSDDAQPVFAIALFSAWAFGAGGGSPSCLVAITTVVALKAAVATRWVPALPRLGAVCQLAARACLVPAPCRPASVVGRGRLRWAAAWLREMTPSVLVAGRGSHVHGQTTGE